MNRIVLGVAIAAICVTVASLFSPQPSPPKPAATVEQKVCTVSLVGDILLGARVGDAARRNGAASLFTRVAPIFTKDDLTIGNFESAASTHGTPAKKTFTFRTHPKHLAALRSSGFQAVSLANNHALDYGQRALLDTLAHLRTARVTPVGAGEDRQSAEQPAYFKTDGGTVALLASSRVLPSGNWAAGKGHPGLASAYNPTALYAGIRRAKEKADFVIVYLHWGVEKAVRPEAYQRKMARACIDAGADAVIGSHPHVLQGFEFYKDKLIAYSLGNFVFTNHNKATVILQLQLHKRTPLRARLIPCRILHFAPTPITTAKDRQALLRQLQALSFGVRVRENGDLAQQ